MAAPPARQLYYAGKLQPATSSKTFQSIDPATGKPLADIEAASRADVDAAVASAKAAFPAWSTTSQAARARILRAAVDILRRENDELAKVETLDTGKPLSETAAVDVASGADVLEYYAGLIAGGGLGGETVQLRPGAVVNTTKEPLGVCVGIGAWNYPIQIALWKSAPCLAAGNCMVYKPSEVTPLHAQRLAQIYSEAGLPPGVFNVVYGDGQVGGWLTTHADVVKVSFTGQVSTGQKVAAAAAGGMRYVTMELGGKSPLIVLPGANVGQAVAGAMMANFYSSGQVCTNGTRVFVPKSLKRQFEAELVRNMAGIRPGPLLDANTNYGPLVSRAHLAKVLGYIDHGKHVDKARVLYDGQPQLDSIAAQKLSDGFWCPPIVFTDCRDDMKIVKEEIFGPVLSILEYDDGQTASTDSVLPAWALAVVARANDTPLGLAAGVFGPPGLAASLVARLDAGICWINTWGESPAEMSVGGWKASGVGVENGRRGIEAWVRSKSVLAEEAGFGSVFEVAKAKL